MDILYYTNNATYNGKIISYNTDISSKHHLIEYYVDDITKKESVALQAAIKEKKIVVIEKEVKITAVYPGNYLRLYLDSNSIRKNDWIDKFSEVNKKTSHISQYKNTEKCKRFDYIKEQKYAFATTVNGKFQKLTIGGVFVLENEDIICITDIIATETGEQSVFFFKCYKFCFFCLCFCLFYYRWICLF